MSVPRAPIGAKGRMRVRRAYRKSRVGCGNCKIRHVKCDEGTPECSKCLSYGVFCNYNPQVEELQPRGALALQGDGQKNLCKIVVPSFSNLQSPELGSTIWHLESFQRFKTRTAVSIGFLGFTEAFDKDFFGMVLHHPILMQLAHGLTLIHDRYLSTNPDRRTVEEICSWNKGVALLNKKLSAPLHPKDHDVLWGAVAIIGVITFASVDARQLQNTWPLTSIAHGEPEWVKMGLGKAMLWDFAQPYKPESVFHRILSMVPKFEGSLDSVPFALLSFYELLDGRSAGNSPYAVPLSGIFLPTGLNVPSSEVIVFYTVTSGMDGEFGRLLRAKDSRALLIMAYWYARISTGPWWLQRRALIEGQATCLYLERFDRHNAALQRLLVSPRQILFASRLP